VTSPHSEVLERERSFWDEHVPGFAEWQHDFESPPDSNTEAMLDALEPVEGRSVLDFACGAGVISAKLAARGAHVTGLDLSPAATAAAATYCNRVAVDATFVTGSLNKLPFKRFDRIAGRYALHHTDVAATAPLLAQRLAPGGVAAFVETMATNPVLRVARRYLAGRLGVARWGTADERPLTREHLQIIRDAFGELRIEVRDLSFFFLLDRNVFRYRSPRLSQACARLDRALLQRAPWWSYHQVLIATAAATLTG
jgi:SAM-dependent methyltransferase